MNSDDVKTQNITNKLHYQLPRIPETIKTRNSKKFPLIVHQTATTINSYSFSLKKKAQVWIWIFGALLQFGFQEKFKRI